jgi:hypothetical protein
MNDDSKWWPPILISYSMVSSRVVCVYLSFDLAAARLFFSLTSALFPFLFFLFVMDEGFGY